MLLFTTFLLNNVFFELLIFYMYSYYHVKEPKTGVRAALSRLPGVNLIYVAEICPPADTAVVGFDLKEAAAVIGESGDGVYQLFKILVKIKENI